MIEPVDEKNLPEAGRVHAASWRASHASFVDGAFLALHTPERQTQYLRELLRQGYRVFLLREEDGRGAGTVAFHPRTGEICALYVLPERWGMGYGGALLDFALGRLSARPRLWVLDNNARARQFYERRGFAPTGQAHLLSAERGISELEYALRG